MPAGVWDDCVSKKIVGYVPLNWSKVVSKFAQFTKHSCRGDFKESYHTCNLFFYEDAKVITWVKNSLKKLDNELHVKAKKCANKNMHVFSFFPTNHRVSAI